jgi:hypothetical protein
MYAEIIISPPFLPTHKIHVIKDMSPVHNFSKGKYRADGVTAQTAESARPSQLELNFAIIT